jgi:hypothetical protein|tara:strand:- start:892 stop:1074 length:183 start_codon:yes stop_codon:yes gene_type:complete
MLGQIIYTLVFAVLLIYVSGIAFSFFGIGFEVYGNYMLWFIALALFASILPPKLTSTIFE